MDQKFQSNYIFQINNPPHSYCVYMLNKYGKRFSKERRRRETKKWNLKISISVNVNKCIGFLVCFSQNIYCHEHERMWFFCVKGWKQIILWLFQLLQSFVHNSISVDLFQSWNGNFFPHICLLSSLPCYTNKHQFVCIFYCHHNIKL